MTKYTNLCHDMQQKCIKHSIGTNIRKWRKISVFKEFLRNDKSTIRVPRHSSFMIMHTFADWGNTGQNMAENLGITTVSTTKAHGWNRDKGKNSLVVGDYLRQCNSSFIKM